MESLWGPTCSRAGAGCLRQCLWPGPGPGPAPSRPPDPGQCSRRQEARCPSVPLSTLTSANNTHAKETGRQGRGTHSRNRGAGKGSLALGRPQSQLRVGLNRGRMGGSLGLSNISTRGGDGQTAEMAEKAHAQPSSRVSTPRLGLGGRQQGGPQQWGEAQAAYEFLLLFGAVLVHQDHSGLEDWK